jgi:hypothetical protein
MPQSTFRYATANLNGAVAVTEQAWVTPQNAQSVSGANPNDGVNATGQANALGLIPLGYTDWTFFNLLAEEGGVPAYGGGVGIPAGATIVSVTTEWEIGVAAGTPTFFYGENVNGVITESSAGVTTYPTVKTRTPTPPTRANMANGKFAMRARMTNSNTLTNSTAQLDFVRVTVTWVVFLDKSGKGAAVGTGAGSKKVQVVRSGKGMAEGVGSGIRKAAVVKIGVAWAVGVGSGVKKIAISNSGKGIAVGVGSGVLRAAVVKIGAGIAVGVGSGTKKVAVVRAGKGMLVGVGSGIRKAAVVKIGTALAVGVGSGIRKTLISKPGTAVASGVGVSGAVSVLISKLGTGMAAGSAIGIERMYTSALSGVTRDANGMVIPAARVDAFRTVDKSFIGSTVSHADTGTYSVIAPSDQTISYFLRSFKAGDPNIFGTTDENLKTTLSQVSGPPED